jgi:hypothetical protein
VKFTREEKNRLLGTIGHLLAKSQGKELGPLVIGGQRIHHHWLIDAAEQIKDEDLKALVRGAGMEDLQDRFIDLETIRKSLGLKKDTTRVLCSQCRKTKTNLRCVVCSKPLCSRCRGAKRSCKKCKDVLKAQEAIMYLDSFFIVLKKLIET